MKSNQFKKTLSNSRNLDCDNITTTNLTVRNSTSIPGMVDLNSAQTLTNKTLSTGTTINTDQPITSTDLGSFRNISLINTFTNFSQLLIKNNEAANTFGITLRHSGTKECGIYKEGSSDNEKGLGFFTFNNINGFIGENGMDLTSGRIYSIDGLPLRDVT